MNDGAASQTGVLGAMPGRLDRGPIGGRLGAAAAGPDRSSGPAGARAATRRAAGPRALLPGGRAPDGGTSLLVHIRSLLPNLAPAERRIGELATADPAGTARLTITGLAGACSTSETTVVRFCRAVGLTGYPELRIALAAAGGQQDGAPRGALGGDIGPDDPLADVVGKIGYADAAAVSETVEQLDLAVLERVVTAMAAAGRTDLYGVGASAFVALDLQQKLHRIGRMAHCWPDPHAALTSAALLRAGDVAIGISHTGSTTDTVMALRRAGQSGAVTVAVTNFPRAPISSVADHVLTTAARETTFRSGATSSRIAALTVVDCLFVALAQRQYAATMQALETTYEAVQQRR